MQINIKVTYSLNIMMINQFSGMTKLKVSEDQNIKYKLSTL